MAKETTAKSLEDLLLDLSKAFLNLSSALSEYRHEHRDELTKKQKDRLEKKRQKLSKLSSELNANAAILKAELVKKDLETLKQAAKDMKKVAEKIEDIKRTIIIATKAIALGGAIATGCVPVIVATGTDLIAEIES
jgi:DNA repair exonuclease SbcCD ATPase subunit